MKAVQHSLLFCPTVSEGVDVLEGDWHVRQRSKSCCSTEIASEGTQASLISAAMQRAI
jgi:hypothetical protein